MEFIICHAEVSIAFVEEKKISEVKSDFQNEDYFVNILEEC